MSGPQNKGDSALGSMLGFPCFWKLPLPGYRARNIAFECCIAYSLTSGRLIWVYGLGRVVSASGYLHMKLV